MRILIVTHAPLGSTKGNRITADRWAQFLADAGHTTFISDHVPNKPLDCLIALHATFASDLIPTFRARNPQAKIVVCLTGTDLHLDLPGHRGELAKKSAEQAIASCDQLVLLEPEGQKQLPPSAREKSTVIVQSAVRVPEAKRESRSESTFQIILIGHLREEKDPFLAAAAARRLPDSSRIQVVHLGAALTATMEDLAQNAMKSSSRYRWLGPVSHQETQVLLSASRAMVLTSRVEGAPSVISEAIVNGVPILATRIPATIGLLGIDYPGLFDVGDEATLCELMLRLENEPSFLDKVTEAIHELKPKFAPAIERNAINALLR